MTTTFKYTNQYEDLVINFVSTWLWLPSIIRMPIMSLISEIFFFYYMLKGAYSNPEKKLDDLVEQYPMIKDPQVAIVTGANSGIGYETARVLAKAGYKVILACRSESKALKAIESIRSKLNKKCDLEFIQLDLMSLSSVKNFAKQFLERGLPLDLLINNAGVMLLPKFEKTEDGFETQYQVNYLSPFLLTYLLAPKLKETSGSKIINLSSLAHYGAGDCDFSTTNEKSKYSPLGNYCKSKAALVMSVSSFQERLGSSGVQVFAAHPGVVATELFRHIPFAVFFSKFIGFVLFKNSLQGALTTLRLALTPNSVLAKKLPSRYFADELPMKTHVFTRDPARQEALWRQTCKDLSIDTSL